MTPMTQNAAMQRITAITDVYNYDLVKWWWQYAAGFRPIYEMTPPEYTEAVKELQKAFPL